MWKLSLAQREMRTQVLLDHGSLGVLLDGFQNLGQKIQLEKKP